MIHLHKDLQLAEGEELEIILDNPANVLLLDPANYELYSQNKPYRYSYGGYATESPVRITTPSAGRWHLVVDLGGGAGHVSATLRILTPQAA